MATKILSLSRGHSGIRIEVIDALITLFNAGVYPCIPEKDPSALRATWRRWRICH